MSRPPVSVVMPFAGSAAEAERALGALAALRVAPGDELILADNTGVARARGGVHVVLAVGERSPSHARNVGAEHAHGEWLLFLDADTHADPELIDQYFAAPIDAPVGALAGEVVALSGATTVAARYGAARQFLGQDAHLAHPYLPRAVAANLLVRRSAFEQIGGFYEGVRAAEDTDFSWRLQRAGWRLEARPRARVEHEYRTSVSALRRQWRGYAAGRAWLSRRYEDFAPEPALRRLVRRRGSGTLRAGRPAGALRAAGAAGAGERARFLALDVVLGVEELAGFTLSNKPRTAGRGSAQVVLVCERFPTLGDPLTDFVETLAGARVEAVSRPEAFDPRAVRELTVDYREDDGVASRLAAVAALALRHPLRCVRDLVRRAPGEPSLPALAPAVRRLLADPGARVHALGGSDARAAAARIAALAGRQLEDA